jgi:hypothetical protein
METSYPVLQKNLLRIARVRAQATRVFTISESGGAIRRLVITSTSNGDYERVLRLHDGDIEVFTRPKQGLRCDISLGLSWLEPIAAYDFDADGRLIDTNGEDRRVAPVLMMHLAAPVIPSLGFAVGLGVGKHSAPDLYLGATLMTFRPIALNVGWVWQRTPQLPSGLGLGQIALDPDLRLLDDLDLKFKNTVYFGIGILR